MKTIQAVYEKGIFRPTEPVDLPEGSVVTIDPGPVREPAPVSSHLSRIYELLGQAEDTDEPHLSSHHEEHQP